MGREVRKQDEKEKNTGDPLVLMFEAG